MRRHGQALRREWAPELVDITAIARFLVVTERYVRRLVTERRIPCMKVSHVVLFDSSEAAASGVSSQWD